ncbi:PLDc N-terminal domain-containing protein [Pseudoclavibacter helvolus]
MQFTLLGAALVSLLRRKPNEVRGSRLAWGVFSLVNFIGPISYFLFGRKR